MQKRKLKKQKLFTDIRGKNVPKSYKCKECEHYFKTKANLNRHIMSVHEGKNAFNCDVCDKKYTTKFGLKNHQDSKHVSDKIAKLYNCMYCDKSFQCYFSHRRHVNYQCGKNPNKK